MGWVALKMLTGDRTKYLGLVFGVAFASMLMSHQVSIFCGLMLRTASQILDVRDAGIWICDPELQSVDEIEPLSDTDLYRVRGVPGVRWAARLSKSLGRVRTADGRYRTAIVMGLDDDSFAGAPQRMLLGSWHDLRRPDGVILDDAGFSYLSPGEPVALGKTLEMNDRRVVVVGICRVAAPFQTFPVMYCRYSQATRYVPQERNTVSFIVADARPDANPAEVCGRIRDRTGLSAYDSRSFMWLTIGYYMRSTGIPVNFGITVALGFIVGTAIAGQTFYLFTLENLKQFGALKAMGVTNSRILMMILLQAAVVGGLGYALGMGAASVFFELTKDIYHLRGFFLPWQVAIGTAGAVLVIMSLASVVSIRRVWTLEPAIVFK
ncbi:MAG: ABC transporter permease [Planctomycetaceae bacterium]